MSLSGVKAFRPARVLPLVVLVLVTAGCAGAAPGSPAGQVIDNCGVRVPVGEPPKRVVALDQETAETLLALGLGDRIAGTAYQTGPVASRYRAEYERLPLLNPKSLTGEQLRAANPDFAASSVTTDFTLDGVGTREELAALGVTSYVSAADCPRFSPGSSAFERLLTDYQNYGRIFGIPDRAAELVRAQRAALATAEAAGAARASRPQVAYLYSVFNGTPYVGGGKGLPSDFSRALRAPNVFDDLDTDWAEASWEQIASRQPSVIVVADLPDRGIDGDTATQKIAMMRAHPVLSLLPSVRDGRFITVPGRELDPTVTSVNALPLLGDGFGRLG